MYMTWPLYYQLLFCYCRTNGILTCHFSLMPFYTYEFISFFRNLSFEECLSISEFLFQPLFFFLSLSLSVSQSVFLCLSLSIHIYLSVSHPYLILLMNRWSYRRAQVWDNKAFELLWVLYQTHLTYLLTYLLICAQQKFAQICLFYPEHAPLLGWDPVHAPGGRS